MKLVHHWGWLLCETYTFVINASYNQKRNIVKIVIPLATDKIPNMIYSIFSVYMEIEDNLEHNLDDSIIHETLN